MALVAQEDKQYSRAQQILAQYLSLSAGSTVPRFSSGRADLPPDGARNTPSKFYAVMNSALGLKLEQFDYYQRLAQAQTSRWNRPGQICRGRRFCRSQTKLARPQPRPDSLRLVHRRASAAHGGRSVSLLEKNPAPPGLELHFVRQFAQTAGRLTTRCATS
jgi:hypothetical protein